MSVLTAPQRFSDEKQAEAYIEQCEDGFRRQVDAVAERILTHPDIKMIGLSGPSCSGKTTTAELLISRLTRAGRRVHLISVDNFFRERTDSRRYMQEPDGEAQLDFDSIDALDFPLFKTCLDELMQKGKTRIPLYSLGEGKRVGSQEYFVSGEDDLFLFEGIQVVYPQLDALFRAYPYRSIFSCVERDLQVGDVTFDPKEIRLLRRLVRDYYFRQSEPEFTFFSWSSVRENEENSIFPYAGGCDERLDSLMGYEIGLLRPHLEAIFAEVPDGSAYRDDADAILSQLERSGAQPLSVGLLPRDALYREFVKRPE